MLKYQAAIGCGAYLAASSLPPAPAQKQADRMCARLKRASASGECCGIHRSFCREVRMPDMTTLIVNGTTHTIDIARDRPLLDILREDLGLTGCKIGCGEGACGSCTVLVDRQPTRSCTTPIGAALGRPILTIEGLAADGQLHPLQQAFLDA